VLLVAGPAWSIDLTGTWTITKSKCKLLRNDGTISKYFFDDGPLWISQVDEDLAVDDQWWSYDGVVYADTKGDGQGIIQRCLPSTFPGQLRSFLIKKAITFPVNGRGVSGKMIVESWQGDKEPDGYCRY
jgi:hypothetical protein